MRILLDENVPEPLAHPLSWLLVGHELVHVNKRWKGIKDKQLYEKARRYRYDLVLSVDSNQLYDVEICKAIQRSGLHAVFLETGTGSLRALAAAGGALIHSIRSIVGDLEKVDGQRIVTIPMLQGEPRYTPHDPRKSAPSPMWPRKQHGDHKPSKPRKKA